jgi:hypothetical protein
LNGESDDGSVVVLKSFKTFKDFQPMGILANAEFQGFWVYRYGGFGVQLWGVGCTDMGDLVCSYGGLGTSSEKH